ncbi:MAG TPA: O-antigen ligase family protein [Thermoleophilaceae bacterium]
MSIARLPAAPLLLVPGALTVYLAFNAGGFFPAAPGWVAVGLAVLLVLRITLAEEPFAGVSPWLVAALGFLGAYCVWVLLSGSWSDSPARALLEFNRDMAYLLALALFGSLAAGSRGVAWMLRGLVLGAFVVCAISLIARIAPDVWPITANISSQRLSYPITYWNALGILCALSIVFCVHLTSSEREPPIVRVLGAAAVPVFATTLYFTFSRGSIVTTAIGLVLYLLIGRPRAMLTGLLAVAPVTAVAVVTAYGKDALSSIDPTTAQAVSEGRDLALVVALCVVGAAALRALLLFADRPLAEFRLPSGTRRPLGIALAVGVVALAVGVTAGFNLPHRVSHQYDRFVHGNVVRDNADLRRRLSDPGNNGRIDVWRVARDEFDRSSFHGSGAGTYETLWNRYRPVPQAAKDGHSLYLETMGELGIVGLILIVGVLASIFGGLIVRRRGPDRALYSVILAAGLAWAIHAGVDWDWEMPVITLWLFALGGAAIGALPDPRAAERGRSETLGPPRLLRVVAGVLVLVLAITPALVASSQASLDASVRAFKRGDCHKAADEALSSISAISARPQPFEILAYCDVRVGLDRLAITQMKKAVKRDPDNWEFQYGLALVTGAAGRDPRPPMRTSLALNPRDSLNQETARAFRKARTPRQWKRRALNARLPFQR